MCVLVNIAKIFDSKPPVASADLLNQKKCGIVSTKKGRSDHSTHSYD